MKKSLVVISMLCLLWGCSTEPRDLKAYYFPVEELKEGKVYYFLSKEDNGPRTSDYWYYKSEKDEGGKDHIKAISLTRKGEPLQFLDYRLDEAEVRLISMHIVETNRETNQKAIIEVEIKQPYVFNLAWQDTSKSLYAEMVWNNPFDSLEYSLQKVRTFKGFEEVEVMGEKRRVLVYNIATEFKSFTPKDGETDSAWPEQEIYAPGIGLAGYIMMPDPDYPLESHLKKTFSKKAFEERYHLDLDALAPTLGAIQRR